VIEVHPGRNSRYARFRYLLVSQDSGEKSSQAQSNETRNSENLMNEQKASGTGQASMTEDVNELTQLVDHLRRRMRNQEMAIALLQDRLAEIEDKIRKR